MGEKATRRYACDLEWMKFPADPEARVSGPVKEYKLSPEELAEYDNLRKPTGKAPFVLPPGRGRKREEAKEMLTGENGTDSFESYVPGNTSVVPDNTGQEPPKPKTRMEVAREKLSSEEYLRLKEEGKADGEIRVLYKIAGDVLVNLKKEWGLVIGPGVATHKQDPVQSPPENTPQPDPVPQPEPEPSPAPVTQLNESRPSGLTIAQVMELREELIEDVDDYNHVLRECEEWVSGRILMALRLQLDIHQQALDRINEVFERTVVEL